MSETEYRFGAFLAALLLLMCVEQLYSGSLVKRGRQIACNLLLATISTLFLRVLFFLSAIAVAYWCNQHQWGLFYWLDLPAWLTFIAAFLILDAAVYWQHRVMHTTALLWRLHQVHHSDLGVDVSTGVRFHPVEIAISQLWKMLVVFFLGAPVSALMFFELALSLCSLFIHTRVVLPWRFESVLARFLVTPAMHRVHHNRDLPDTDTNYSTVLSLWDRIFGSYRAPNKGEQITFGLHSYPQRLSVINLLLLPFRTTTRIDK